MRNRDFHYKGMVAEMHSLGSKKMEAIRKLKVLLPKTHKTTPAGLVSRYSFVSLVFRSGLYRELLDGELYDLYHLSERDLDTCFEMYDGSDVVAEVIRQASVDSLLKTMLAECLSKETLETWTTTVNEVRERNISPQSTLF